MAEGEQHEDAVARVKIMLRDRGHECPENSNERGERGFAFPALMIDGVISPFTADVLAIRGYWRFIVEVDGQKPGQGHSSERAKAGDHRRDRIFWDYFGIPTVRLWTSELVGDGAFDDPMIMKEIDFQLGFWREYGRPPLK